MLDSEMLSTDFVQNTITPKENVRIIILTIM